MTVYFSFIPSSAEAATVVRMEFAPNLEVPQRVLQKRARERCSQTYYEGVRRYRDGPQPDEEFPTADLSAFMIVWRRRSMEPVPARGDQPDEVWSLTALGGVVRERWDWYVPESQFVAEPVPEPAPVRKARRKARPAPELDMVVERPMSTVRSVWLAPLEEGGDIVMVREVVAPPRAVCTCGVVPDVNARCRCS